MTVVVLDAHNLAVIALVLVLIALVILHFGGSESSTVEDQTMRVPVPMPPYPTVAVAAPTTAAGRSEIIARWYRRADELDNYARGLRFVGDTMAAMDAEAAAVDYRQAAGDLEASRA